MQLRAHREAPADPDPCYSVDALVARADAAMDALAGLCDDAQVEAATPLVEALRNARDYPRMSQLAEAIRRHRPDDVRNRRLQAQALIENGLASVAVDVLQALSARCDATHPERLEALGLLGRAWKQIFFDAADKAAPAAHHAIAAAIDAYRAGYSGEPAVPGTNRTWLGVNLLALAYRARRLGRRRGTGARLRSGRARSRVPDREHAAAVHAGLGSRWKRRRRRARPRSGRAAAGTPARRAPFGSAARAWRGGRVAGRSSAFRRAAGSGARHVRPADLRMVDDRSAAGPLGGSHQRRLGKRIGTGFLVRAGDFGLAPGDELLVLTNFHVVNPSRERQDATLLRLRRPVTAIEPLPLAPRLPTWPVADAG